ncbi:MAG: long-chain-fatty-acid--CoA ligase [Intrasporangium sp.]|uniref:long-chain-fatty-acid--CoA ligase n=1 Tax=Intrasporangium sp. TaxID=1925024 RepID=UPI0026483CBA|nr:long-chain-fatty-acid--CoA ligase [Intrasporangium sp.]MDN5797401.1 long-chain-fatty-acid--CoA ligase [Intrasporangium sp.]
MGDGSLPVFRTELTPLSLLGRSAAVFPDKDAIVYGERRLTYREFGAAATRLARALQASGIEPGDRVAYLMPNLPELLIAHFGVPLTGAVLVPINTRLSPEEVGYILEHSGARILVVDAELAVPLGTLGHRLPESVEQVVTVTDPAAPGPAEAALSGPSYEQFLARGTDEPLPWTVPDETATITINYTSGTTGRPKGVMYHHRGAYLNSLGEVIHSRHSLESVYLWTLPMFHCNGWCTTWGVTGAGGTHVCLRTVDAAEIWRLFDAERVTHLNGAPVVLSLVANHPAAHRLDHSLVVTTAGAAPSPSIIEQMGQLGATIVHVYGLTETYGPYSVCEWQPGWPDLEVGQRARLLARQGVGMVCADRMRVVDDELDDVPADGATMGEIVMHGNNVMTGYFRDPEATAKAFGGGWFHSGDLGVLHPDGYVELRDRAKDVVVSGGENISTVEVEQALLSHPAVLEAAVIGAPDDRWGERPKAFVVVRPGQAVEPGVLVEHVRGRIARFKAPREVELVDELPKTSTGKVQKYTLREREWAGHASRIKG